MTTQQQIDYALMAGSVYVSSRNIINELPTPAGWIPFNYQLPSGLSASFEAVSFVNGGDIVISYAGTNPTSIPDWANNIVLGLTTITGELSPQLYQAAEYYLEVKAANPTKNISFTGHSLGGGLASLMAVFFNEQAITFDQAPFANSANQAIATILKIYLLDRGYSSTDLLGLSDFISAPNNTIPNASNVTNINVQGEFLSLVTSGFRIGTQTNIVNSGSTSPVNLHSQGLLTAFLLSNKTSVVLGETLDAVTLKLNNLLPMMFDQNLFGRPIDIGNATERNFVEHLVQHQQGFSGVAVSRLGATAPAIQADNMITRFTADLWKLAQDGGLTMNDSNAFNPDLNYISKALTAFAMQMYYEDTPAAKDATKHLFTDVTGGVTFDMADVSQKILEAFTQSTPVELKEAKGYAYFLNYLNVLDPFTVEEKQLIQSALPNMRDWYVQAGTTGMNTTDTHNRGAFMLGGATNDNLTGGNKADLLVGNAGNDSLNGGDGDDILLGGADQNTLNGDAGNDILIGGADVDILDGGNGNDQLKGGDSVDLYQFTGTYGTDIITDSDGQGFISIDNTPANSGTFKLENIYKNDSTGYTFTRVNGGNSVVISKDNDPNRIIINDWSEANNLSINLTGSAPTPQATLTGDFKKLINENTYVIGADGNYVDDGAQAGALDLINGTAGNDVMDGKAGSDYLNGKAGDDYILGGTAGDSIQGGLGKDTLIGGDGDDLIYGASDDDINMPSSINSTPPTTTWAHMRGIGFNWVSGYNDSDLYSNGTPLGYTNPSPRNRLADDQGNLIDGGAGNDFIAAGTGADYVHGGADKDLIWGMDKDDILFGDGGNDVIYGDGNKESPASAVWTSPANLGNDIIDGGDGEDIIYGQGGNDIIFGGADNDLIWGDDPLYYTELSGNDFLFGGAGDDYLEGGGGNDYLDGGANDNRLFGGTGNDTLISNDGNDVLVGGEGDDTYIVNSTGVRNILDTQGENTIHFGAGFNPDNLKLGLGSLLLDFGNGSQVHIHNFKQNDVFNSSTNFNFQFANGTNLSTSQLLARGFDLDGTDADDAIAGTNITDRMNGLDGNDTMTGGDGNDVMNGGAGNDHVHGGAENDFILGMDKADILFGGSDRCNVVNDNEWSMAA